MTWTDYKHLSVVEMDGVTLVVTLDFSDGAEISWSPHAIAERDGTIMHYAISQLYFHRDREDAKRAVVEWLERREAINFFAPAHT